MRNEDDDELNDYEWQPECFEGVVGVHKRMHQKVDDSRPPLIIQLFDHLII